MVETKEDLIEALFGVPFRALSYSSWQLVKNAQNSKKSTVPVPVVSNAAHIALKSLWVISLLSPPLLTKFHSSSFVIWPFLLSSILLNSSWSTLGLRLNRRRNKQKRQCIIKRRCITSVKASKVFERFPNNKSLLTSS